MWPLRGVSRATAYQWLTRSQRRAGGFGRSFEQTAPQSSADRCAGRGTGPGVAPRPTARAGVDRRRARVRSIRNAQPQVLTRASEPQGDRACPDHLDPPSAVVHRPQSSPRAVRRRWLSLTVTPASAVIRVRATSRTRVTPRRDRRGRARCQGRDLRAVRRLRARREGHLLHGRRPRDRVVQRPSGQRDSGARTALTAGTPGRLWFGENPRIRTTGWRPTGPVRHVGCVRGPGGGQPRCVALRADRTVAPTRKGAR